MAYGYARRPFLLADAGRASQRRGGLRVGRSHGPAACAPNPRYVSPPGKLPLEEARTILRQLLKALAHCHGQGVTHRNLKPKYVLLHPRPSDAAAPAALSPRSVPYTSSSPRPAAARSFSAW